MIGVWTRETIPVRTCFGPLIGQQSHSLEVADWTDKAASHIWKVSGVTADRACQHAFIWCKLPHDSSLNIIILAKSQK